MSIETSAAAVPSKVRLAANLGTLESATINGKTANIDHDIGVFDGAMLRGKLEIMAHYK
jgi:hypothetical protein